MSLTEKLRKIQETAPQIDPAFVEQRDVYERLQSLGLIKPVRPLTIPTTPSPFTIRIRWA